MKVELKKWSLDDKKQLMDICNSVEREYLSDRLPYPYTEECADWWLNMVLEHDGKDGVFRAIVADGKIVGNISVEQKSDVYKKDAEIGYMLATEEWSRGDHDGSGEENLRRGLCGASYSSDHRNGLRTEHGIQTGAGEKWI